jgi:hypothetical protein
MATSRDARSRLLYRCSTDGNNVVLYECFGDLGTCPTTAVEAAELLFDATVSPTEVEPGGTLTVTATDCLYPLGGAVLLRDGVGLGVGDSTPVDPDGSFTIDLVVPAATTPGPLTVQVDCGFDGQTVLSIDLDAMVPGETPPTTEPGPTPAPAAAPAAAPVAAPRFTG